MDFLKCQPGDARPNDRANKPARKPLLATLILGALLTVSPAARADAPPDFGPQVEALGSADEAKREQAYVTLFKAGRAAREALRGQIDSPSVQRRKLVRQLLKEMPLFDANEPQTLRELLTGYQEANVDAKPEMALKIAVMGREADHSSMADEALVRVCFEDPDAQLTWAVLGRLESSDRERIAALARKETISPATAPQYFLLGDTSTDRAERLALFGTCFDLVREVPPSGYAAISRVANVLADQARLDKDAQRELDVRRTVALLIPNGSDNTLSMAAQRYIEARVRLRNADGFDDDLQTLDIDPKHPTVWLAKSVIRNLPQAVATVPMPARDVPEAIRKAVDQTNPKGLVPALDVLYRAGDYGLVDALAARAISQLGGNDPTVQELRVQLQFVRYNVARAAKNPALAAEMLKTVIAKLEKNQQVIRTDAEGNTTAIPLADLLAEMHIATIHQAMIDDDKATIDATLDQLELLPISDSSLAIDAIYIFEKFDRLEAADEVYALYVATVYDALEHQRTSQTLNSVAWFCARTGRNLDRAYAMATEATKLAPQSAALMDTLAEAAFRLGKVEEAVGLESKAIETGTYDNGFMQKQLARFQAGLKPGDATRAMPSESWGE